MKRLFFLVFLLLLSTQLLISEEITDDQLRIWWSQKSESEKFSVLREYVQIKNATPEVQFPSFAMVQTDSEALVVAEKGKTLDVKVAGGALSYSISFPDLKFKIQPVYKSSPVEIVLWTMGGVVVGSFATFVLEAFTR